MGHMGRSSRWLAMRRLRENDHRLTFGEEAFDDGFMGGYTMSSAYKSIYANGADLMGNYFFWGNFL